VSEIHQIWNLNHLKHGDYNVYHLDTSIYPNVVNQVVFLTLTLCVFCEVENVPLLYCVLHPNLRFAELHVQSFVKIEFATCGQERNYVRAVNG
jgi:hypothetical protein